MEWSVQFNHNDSLNPIFINNLFYFLVSKGVKYNAGKYEGSYFIYGAEPGKDIEHFEDGIKESTVKLIEIVDTFLKFDLNTTSLGVHLDYFGDKKFHFWISILQVEQKKSFISIGTNENEILDEKTFLSFINLCKEVFEKFNFAFGAYRNEYMDEIPFNEEDFLKELPDIANFYSKPLVDKIGREKLLSAPATKVEELENGGLMLLVCTEQLGCPDELDGVWRHLGYG